MAKKKKGGGRKKATARKSVSKKAKARRGTAGKAKARKKAVKKAARKPASRKKAAKAAPKAVSGKFNLLVTFNPNHAGTAEKELSEVLKKIGEKPRIAAIKDIEGLFKVAVSDARKVVSRLKSLCQADPDRFVATHHYTPIDSWCKSDMAEMKSRIKSLVPGIGKNDRWRMGLNKRHWDKTGQTDLIVSLTGVIDRPNVDLSNPQKIVQVEIIGNEAGIALLQKEETLNVAEVKEKA